MLNTKLAGLTHEEIKKFYDNIFEKYPDMKKNYIELNTNKNPFERIELMNTKPGSFEKLVGEEPVFIIIKKLKKFLNELKKLKKKWVLVVAHGGTIKFMNMIISNTTMDLFGECSINIIPNEVRKKCIDKKHDINNTTLIACLFKNNKVTLVIAPNTLHLLNQN